MALFVPMRELGFQNDFYEGSNLREFSGVKARIYHPICLGICKSF